MLLRTSAVLEGAVAILATVVLRYTAGSNQTSIVPPLCNVCARSRYSFCCKISSACSANRSSLDEGGCETCMFNIDVDG